MCIVHTLREYALYTDRYEQLNIKVKRGLTIQSRIFAIEKRHKIID